MPKELNGFSPSHPAAVENYIITHSVESSLRKNKKWNRAARQNYSVQSRADREKLVKVNEKTLAK